MINIRTLLETLKKFEITRRVSMNVYIGIIINQLFLAIGVPSSSRQFWAIIDIIMEFV